MLFSPETYATHEELYAAFICANANSDTQIDGIDVFGYLNGTAYAVVEIYDRESDDYWLIAGEQI